jgi:hypothetical protein
VVGGTEMKNLSDGELINQAAGFSCGCDKCLARVEPPRMELLSRLERGRKAIEAIEELSKELGIVCVEVLQGKYEGIKDFANAYPITFDEGKPILKYLTLKDIADRIDYQQSEEAEG